jgi:hypothetical protein
MEWCKGCYRDANGECEAFRAPWEGCFAKETNRDKYIRDQKKLLRYNLMVRNKRGIEACRESLQRVQGAID